MRGERLLAAAGMVLVGCGAWLVGASHGPMRDLALDAGSACPAVPVRVLEPTAASSGGAAVVFHALGANRIVMLTLGQALAAAGLKVYLVDSPGHGNNASPFSFFRAEQCAAAALRTLERRGEISASRTVVLGHSMGGGLAVRMADYFPAAGTIALAAAPEALPRRMPSNLLLVAPVLDMPPVKQMEDSMTAAAGGARRLPEDFRQRRAFERFDVRRQSHTSVIFEPNTARTVAGWAVSCVGGALPAGYSVPWKGFLGGIMGVVGLMFAFPLAASGLAGAAETMGARRQAGGIRPLEVLTYWSLAAILAAAVLTLWVPLALTRMYSADYLVSLALVAGIPLLVLLRGEWRSGLGLDLRAVATGGALGLAVMLVFGAWMNWQLTDAWLTGARWARWPVLATGLFPLCLAEEIALGAPPMGLLSARLSRFGNFLLMRLTVWAVTSLAVFFALSNALLVVLLFALLGIFSVCQRLGADALRTRTGSAASAAIFSAILGAWLLAAVFPLT